MAEEKKYTVKEFKKYLMKSDSLGDAAYYCDEEHIDEAISTARPEEIDPCIDCNQGDCQTCTL